MSEGLPPVLLRALFRRWSFRIQDLTEQLEAAENNQKSLRRKQERVAGKYESRRLKVDWEVRSQVIELIRIAERIDRIARILDIKQQHIQILQGQVEDARRMKNQVEDNLYC